MCPCLRLCVCTRLPVRPTQRQTGGRQREGAGLGVPWLAGWLAGSSGKEAWYGAPAFGTFVPPRDLTSGMYGWPHSHTPTRLPTLFPIHVSPMHTGLFLPPCLACASVVSRWRPALIRASLITSLPLSLAACLPACRHTSLSTLMRLAVYTTQNITWMGSSGWEDRCGAT